MVNTSGRPNQSNGNRIMDRSNTLDSTITSPGVLIDDQPKSSFGRLWQRFRQELRRPSLLSSSSESDTTGLDILDSASPATRDALRLLGATKNGKRRKSTLRSGTRRADSSVGGPLTPGDDLDEKDDDEPVEIVVIDNEMPEEDELVRHNSAGGGTDTWTRSDIGGMAKSPRSKTSGSDDMAGRMMSKIKAMAVLVFYFFNSRFAERAKERSFLKERYYGQRQLSFAASWFFLAMWVWFLCLTPRPWDVYTKYAFIGIYGGLTIPLLPMVCINLPYRAPWIWQVWLGLATWALPTLSLIQLKTCHFFGQNPKREAQCGTQTDFIVFASAIGQGTLAILAMGQSRFIATIGFVIWFAMIAVFYFGAMSSLTFYRDSIYYLVFHVFLMVINFIAERNARQLFELREQLKLQYKATQRAQMMEKKASDLTKRFVSYIFHEVRVPLNTALLSVQNLEGEDLFAEYTGDQKEMVDGLTGSLSMMEKVLNDVLSFNRMETGTFTQAKVPFDLHKSIQLTVLSHTSPAHMKGINLEVHLDPRIDKLDCLFIGDEMRLRQITSNLVSNSLKFTQDGSVKIVTRLLFPKLEIDQITVNGESKAHDPEKGDEPVEAKRNTSRTAVVRIEVHDTGAGLRKRDLEDNRLFSPYVQTEMGRRQGGKGTGLGLALIRQIVQLSNGRLGVNSQYGKGSEFWFELPYPISPRSRAREQITQSTSTGVSDATAVEPLDVSDKTLKSNVQSLPNSAHHPRGFPLERQMTAEQFLVSGPPDRDNITPKSQRERGYFTEVPGSKKLVPPLAHRQGSGHSLPDARSRSPFAPDLDLRRISSSRSRIRQEVPRARFAPPKSDPPSLRSTSPHPKPAEISVPLPKHPMVASPLSLAPPVPIAGRTKDPDREMDMDVSRTGERDDAIGNGYQASPAEVTSILKTVPGPSDSVPSAPSVPAGPPNDDSSPLHVLVVDDDKLTRMMMARMLKRLGHLVDTAENGQIALDKISDAFHLVEGSVPVDVVFLDNQMPMLTGVEVASQVRELGCPLFIVGCTGNALRQDQEEYTDAGADRILTKPIKQHRIEECIVEARKRMRGESVPVGFGEHEEEIEDMAPTPPNEG